MKKVKKNNLLHVFGIALKLFPVLFILLCFSIVGLFTPRSDELVILFFKAASIISLSLIIILWGYVTAKLVFSISSKKGIFLKIVAWPVVGVVVGLIFYLAFYAAFLLTSAALGSVVDVIELINRFRE